MGDSMAAFSEQIIGEFCTNEDVYNVAVGGMTAATYIATVPDTNACAATEDIILGPFLTCLSARHVPTRAARYALLCARAYWMLIGACNPMLRYARFTGPIIFIIIFRASGVCRSNRRGVHLAFDRWERLPVRET